MSPAEEASMLRILALSVLLLAAAPVRAQEPYDPERAGHPLRVAAYIAHPVGWLLDRLIFYPAWWIGGHEPLRSIFGHDGLPGERVDAEVRTAPPAPGEPSAPTEPEPAPPE
jgi:hypothetical protein